MKSINKTNNIFAQVILGMTYVQILLGLVYLTAKTIGSLPASLILGIGLLFPIVMGEFKNGHG